MPAGSKTPFARRSVEPNLLRELRTHARVFGHMSLHGGLAAFLSGRQPVLDVDANWDSCPTSEEDRKRVHRVLTHAFGISAVGRTFYAHSLAVDTASLLRGMISLEPCSTLCLDLVISKLLAMQECMVTGAKRPGEKAAFDPTIFKPAIQAIRAARVCDYVRAEEGSRRVIVFVAAVRRTDCDLTSAFPDGFAKAFEDAVSLKKVDDPKAAALSDTITQFCDVHTPQAAIAAVRTLLDEVKLDHLWHAHMDQMEKDFETGEVVRYQDFVAKGHRLIQSGEWVRNPHSPQKMSARKRRKNVGKAVVQKQIRNSAENSEPKTPEIPSNAPDSDKPAATLAVEAKKNISLMNNGHRQTSDNSGSDTGKPGSGQLSEDQSDVVKADSQSRKEQPSRRSATKQNVDSDKREEGAAISCSAVRGQSILTPASWKLEAEEEVIPVRYQHPARRRSAPRDPQPSPVFEGDESEITEIPLHHSGGKRPLEASGKTQSRKRRRFTAPPDTMPEDSEVEDLTEAQKYMFDVYTRGQGVGLADQNWNSGRPSRYPAPLPIEGVVQTRSKPSIRRHSSVLDVLPEDAMERYDLSLIVNDVRSSRRRRRLSRKS